MTNKVSSCEPSVLQSGVENVQFGERVTLVAPVNIYGCQIGADCFVGPFVEIQQGVRIGDRCRIQSHSFVCDLVTIGEDCVIAHGVVFINDAFSSGGPANRDRSKWRATSIGDRVSIGSNATLLPVDVCSDVVIGAGSVVVNDIISPGIYAGNPARKIRSQA